MFHQQYVLIIDWFSWGELANLVSGRVTGGKILPPKFVAGQILSWRSSTTLDFWRSVKVERKFLEMGVSKNPKMDDLGIPLFLETPKWGMVGVFFAPTQWSTPTWLLLWKVIKFTPPHHHGSVGKWRNLHDLVWNRGKVFQWKRCFGWKLQLLFHGFQLLGVVYWVVVGNSNIFEIFTPNIVENEPNLTSICFLMGWFNHPTSLRWCFYFVSWH